MGKGSGKGQTWFAPYPSSLPPRVVGARGECLRVALANVLLHASSPHAPPSMADLSVYMDGDDPAGADGGGGLPLSAAIRWAASLKPRLSLVHSASEEATMGSVGRVLGYLEPEPGVPPTAPHLQIGRAHV